jgi:membrane protease YdiL (CAAX protease family)
MKQISKTWNQAPVIFRAILSGFFVSSIGVFIWGGMLSAFMSVWVIIPMIPILWLFWKFFSGAWGRFNAFRAAQFRLTSLSPHVCKWGLLGAVLFVAIVQSSFVLTFRLVDFPAAKFMADYTVINRFPLWAAWAILIMGSIVAGICEEAGFRGYMQVPLEKRYGAVTGIVITSICFTVIHLGHTWALPILPHIFFASVLLGILAFKTGSLIPGIIGHSILDIFDYSFWWTNITGGFHKQTIFKTGIDLHFIIWVLLFLSAIYCFFKVIDRLNKADSSELIIARIAD